MDDEDVDGRRNTANGNKGARNLKNAAPVKPRDVSPKSWKKAQKLLKDKKKNLELNIGDLKISNNQEEATSPSNNEKKRVISNRHHKHHE